MDDDRLPAMPLVLPARLGRISIQGAFVCLAFVAGTMTAAGCLRTEAKTPGPAPALAVPTPPSRTLVPSTVEPEPVPPSASAGAATDPPSRPTEPPPAARTPPPPATPPTTPPTPVVDTPPPVLQTTANVSALEARVREILLEAEQRLNKVKPDALSREARDHFNTAWSHVRTAKEAIGYRNFVFAKELAEKALALARQLVK